MIKRLFSFLFLFFLIPGVVTAENNSISGGDSWENPDTTMSGTTAQRYKLFATNEISPVSDLEDLSALIYEKMKNYETNIVIPFKGNTSNIMAELKDMFVAFGEKDDYYYGTISTWKYGYKGYTNDITITIQVEYLTNAQQELFVDEQVEKIAALLLDTGMSDVQKVKAVNDYIVLNTSYSVDTIASPHAAYTILAEGKGVCQAYALLAYRLLDKMGMEVRYVVGDAGGIGHAWNLVKVDGEWYQLDTTWNDPLPNRDGIVGYNYFLVSDTVLEKDHTWKRNNYMNATSEKYSFVQDIYHLSLLNDYLIYSSISDDYKLYRMNLVTKENVKIANTSAFYPVAKGEWVYFSDFNKGGYLTKVKIDGTSQTVLNGVYSTNLAIEGNILTFKKADNSYGSILLVDVVEEPVTPSPSEDELAAKLVIEQINNLNEQDIKFKEDVSTVRALYDNLTAAAKARVTNLSIMEDAEQLVKEMEKIKIDPQRFDTWNEKQTKDLEKEWIISFSLGINMNKVTADNVYIIDNNGNKVAFVKPEFMSATQIKVKNNGVFTKGKTYYVVIEDSVESIKGKQLKKGIYMPFKVQ